jgi:drug/metabolite transporter (DMT)-like permease
VLVPFLSWLILKRKPKIKNYLAAILCFVGVAFVALLGKHENASNELLGDCLTLCCGLFYALQIIFIEKHTHNEDSIQILFYELLTVALICAGFTSFYEFPQNYSYFSLSGEAIWKILYLAVFATCFAQFGQIIGQKYTSPTSTSLILSLETVFGVIFDLLLGNAKLTPFIIIGFSMIFIAEIVNELSFTTIKNKILEQKKAKINDKN